jgi:DNA-binding response OmpR family regulator
MGAPAAQRTLTPVNDPPLLIAVVDDEATVRRALRRLLRSWGFEVECFESGADFLAWLSDHRPECLVLDLHMPQTDGFTVLGQLAKTQPPLPVVIITGRDTPETQARVRDLCGAPYLCKPVDGESLIAAINASITRAAS